MTDSGLTLQLMRHVAPTAGRLFASVLMSLFLLIGAAGCSKLSGSTGFDSEGYKFPGVGAVRANDNGTYSVTWEAAPAKAPMYAIYLKRGTDADPTAVGVGFDFTQPWQRTSDTSVTTDNLLLSHNTCFAVRLDIAGYNDVNTAMVCTGHEKFAFPGVASLAPREGGRFALSWAAVPDTEVTYSVYTRDAAASESYDFSADPLMVTGDTLVETRAFPLDESRCFLVRFRSRLSASDANTKELCSTDDGVADFLGVNAVTSVIAGQVTVSWVKSVNAAVVGYRVYQGIGFSKNTGEAEATANGIALTGFAPGERLEFGVRAFDRLGREDSNTKTISVVVSDAEVAAGTFPGCVSAEGLDTSRIRVTVAFPTGASSMKVYRDAVLVGTLASGTTAITDSQLPEGATFNYTCQAMINGVPTQGTATVQGTTANVNPPTFSGLESVTGSSSRQVKLVWPAPGQGAPVDEFRVYVRPGITAPAIDNTNLVTTVSSTQREAYVSDLGDELQYTFIVTACTAANLCSGQTKSVTSEALPDAGMPRTPGATAVAMSQGSVVITAPWSHEMGGIGKRRIYRRNPEAVNGVTIGGYLYELVRAEVVTDPYNPPTTLTVTGLLANTTYYFIVRDEDTQSPANVSQNTAVVSVQSGDINPPVFPGISELVAGGNVESELVARFAAVASEGVDSDGPSHYMLYVTTATPPASPDNPCNATTATQQVDASLYAEGQTVAVTLAGLTPRRNVAVCVKARDTAGNLSNTTTSLAAVTQDVTPPVFDGLQTLAYSNGSEKLELRWNAATSPTSDVRDYKVTLWRCESAQLSNPDCSASSDVVILEGVTSSTGTDLARSTFTPSLASNNKVSIKVNACDNASPTYAPSDNCTATTRILSVTLPDVDPPPGFSGIVSAVVTPATEGALRASWTAPASWSDYRGFKVYSVTPSETLTLLKDCSCSAAGCPLYPTYCDVSGLEVRRSYSLFVRAYDAAGNHTAIPASPYAASRSATTLDLTAPTFIPNLNASFVSTGTRGVNVTWSSATDNQSAAEAGATITYKVYRKVGSTFSAFSTTTPPADGAQLVGTTSTSYLNGVANLTANTTEYYTVCAFDASNNAKCDPNSVRTVTIPRLTAPTFAGMSALTVGGSGGADPNTSATITFTPVAPENLHRSTGATDYPMYTIDTNPRTGGDPANACTSTSPAPVYKGAILGPTTEPVQVTDYVLSGLTSRRKYSVCLKARDSLGNESATTAAFTVVTQDVTPPTFSGLQTAEYNGSQQTIDLAWMASSSSDMKNYRIKVWKVVGGVPQAPSAILRDKDDSPTGYSLTQTDFAFASNDELRILVDACDDAAPEFAIADNCTAFADNTAKTILLPDVDPPTGFTGVTNVADLSPRATGSVRVTWAAMSDWSDVRGFKVYDVLANPSSPTLLRDCPCSGNACPNQITTCDITGLDAGRTYRFYARAYDAAGNESVMANPNPTTNYRAFRTADLVAPTFTSSLQGSYVTTPAAGISLGWNAATDNQYAAEPNTVGYRLYRKQGSTFSDTSRATIESEGTQMTLTADIARVFDDPVAGLTDGVTYYYTACAFDREPQATGGNTTCDGVVRSVTVPDITAPTVSNLAGSSALLTRNAPSFNLTWSLSDNVTPAGSVVVTVRKKINATNSTDFPATDASIYRTEVGLTSLTGEEGQNDVNNWVTYRITVADSANNSRNDYTFSVQNNRAAVPVTIGTPTATIANSTANISYPVTYEGAATILDSAEYLAKVTLNTTGTATCSKGVSGTGLTTRSVNLSNCTGDGTVGVSLATGTAKDASNNDSAAAGPSATVTVDNTAPTPAITTPAPSAYFNSASGVAVSGTCESGRNVAIGGSGVQTGDTVACTAGTFSGSVTLVSGDASKSITASQTDVAGNTGTSASVTVTLDTTHPIVTVTSPAANTATQGEILFTGACEANLSVFFAGDGVLNPPQMAGCTAGTYSYSVSLTAGDGAKSVSVEQIDLAGNVSAPLSVSVRRDQTAPTVSIGNPSAGVSPPVNSGTAVTYTLSFADTGGSGVQTVTMSASDITLTTTGGATCSKAISGSGTSARSVTLTNCTGNGTVAISVAAGKIADAAGNTSAAVGPSAAFNVDNTAPVLTVTSPAADTQIKDAFTLTGACEGSLEVKVTSTGIVTSPSTTTCASGSYSLALTLTGGDGSKSLTVTSTDGAGNQSIVNHTVVRDATAPVLTITAPAAATVFYSSYVTLALTGTCESGLTVLLEGDVLSSQSTPCSGGSFRFAAWSLTSGDAAKTVTVRQTDAAGNTTGVSRSFTLNSAANPAPMVNDDSVLSYPAGLHHILTGMCNSGGAYTTTATSAQALSVSTSCTGGALNVNLLFPEGGPRDITVTVTTSEVAQPASNWSDVVTFKQQFFCPKGYVGVPGKFASDTDTAGLGNASAAAGHANAGLDPTRDFCVMKYPAKVATSNHGGQTPWEPIYDGNKDFITGSGTTIKENYWPESRAHSTPWVNITRDEAIDRCKALNEAYGLCTGSGCYSAFDNAEYGYRLMSNTQWQVIARNLEKTGGNWTSGTHMNGYLFRGHTDDAIGSNTDLHTQTFAGSSQKSLSHPRRDSGSDYFGTGNSSSQGSTASSGWQERRRFVLSSGASIWDMAGNVWQWVSDNRANLGITAEDDAAGMSTNAWSSYLNGGVNRFSETGNLIFGNFGNGGVQFSESLNAGQLYGGSAGAVRRGGYWYNSSNFGLFAASLYVGPAVSDFNFGFRCAFPGPSLSLDPLDSGAPTVGAVERRDNWGAALGSNPSVTVGAGGVWHLGWAVSDIEVDDWRIYVQVRRKIAATNVDFPTATDPVYRGDFNLTSLKDETAWVLDEGTGQYTRNDGKYLNYRITAIDPHGNIDEETFSVEVTQSCPPGYVGVPGGNTTAGLGHVSASVGNDDKQLDPSLEFCIMKYPAKVMSAGTTAAQDAVGGKFEPILNGYGTFTNAYDYTDSATFNTKVKYLPESRPDSTPWVNISRDDSIKACRALQMQYFGTMPDTSTGTGFQLLSNTQWQVAARNLKATATNWSGGAVGTGVLNRGHTDNASYTGAVINSWNMDNDPANDATTSTSLALPGSVSDANSYFGTGNAVTNSWPLLGGQTLAAGDEQKRTFNLSNGAVLWDMAGNVWQWVKDNNSDGTGSGGDMGVSAALRAANTWWDYNNGSLTAEDLLLFGSAGGYTSTQNAGRVYGQSAGAVRRGGSWDPGSGNGLFAARLSNGPANSYYNIGFRCAFRP